MKLKYKTIIFNEFTIEMKSEDIINVSKNNKKINLDDVFCAWGYICKNCAIKYGLNINELNEEPDGMVCYIDGCLQLNDAYSIYVDSSNVQNIQILTRSK